MLDYEQIDQFINKCVRCGTCKYVFGLYRPSCPAGEKFRFESYYSSGKIWIARAIKQGRVSFDDPGIIDIFYACTLCGNCTKQCPMEVSENVIDVFEAIRAEAVRLKAGPLPAQKNLISGIQNYSNPWMQPRSARGRWAKKLKIKKLPEEKARVLYYVGCTAALDRSLQHVAHNTAEILLKMEVDVGVLAEDEPCCCSILLRIGARETAKEKIARNIELFNSLDVDTIITSCAGCYRSLVKDYPAFGRINAEILHSSQFLLRQLKNGRLKLTEPQKVTVTYHDPCHLGRHLEVYDEPRELLAAVPGVRAVEMPRNRDNSWCCGAGGGVRTAFPDWAVETAGLRVDEAQDTGAMLLVSTCPFCFQNLAAAIAGKDSHLEMTDMTTLVRKAQK